MYMIGFSVLRKLQTRAIGDRWLRICTFRPLNMFHSPQNRSNRSACDWPPSSPRMSNTRGGGSSTTLFSSLFSSSTTFLVSSSLVNAFSRALTAFFVLVHHVVLQSRLQLPPPATVYIFARFVLAGPVPARIRSRWTAPCRPTHTSPTSIHHRRHLQSA
jgi:hypothetical protein